jgi:predicted dehydrogenase
VAFTKALNDPKATGELAGVKIVAAYPGGSPDLPASWNRVNGYTDMVRRMGVEIVGSINELLKRVDVVLLESVDGRPHLAQARPVIAAGKPLFIDKPMAASLANAMLIFQLAKEKNVPCFSASSLRFSSGFQAARSGKSFGKIRSCTAWSPMTIEPHHPDLFWYGIHGVETLFTVMGPGCETVTRVGPEKVLGVWKGGRRGTFVADRKGYGAQVEGSRGSGNAGRYEGYLPLLVEIVKFFKTRKPPVSAEETLEVLAFMEAADESKRHNGEPVTIESVMKKAQQQVAERSN